MPSIAVPAAGGTLVGMPVLRWQGAPLGFRPVTALPVPTTAPPFPLRRWLLTFACLAIAARLVRWGLGFPFWGDEAFLALNIVDRGFGDLLRPLHTNQVAPPLFMSLEIAAHRWLGTGERALRLVPLLAGLLALWPCLVVARSMMQPFGRRGALGLLFAFAFLSVSYFAIRYGAEVKPYTMDLLATTLTLLLVVRVLLASTPRQARRRLAVCTAVCALLLWFSFPVVFTVAGAGLALLLAARQGRLRLRDVLLAGLVLAVSFGALYLLVMRPQLAESHGGGEFLRSYWASAFPPSAPLPLLIWLAQAHTGVLFVYPNGGTDGASSISFLLAVVGAWVLWRGRLPGDDRASPGAAQETRRTTRLFLVLLVAPFLLNLIAAALHRYPYGGHPRLTLHLAPLVCLLAGFGAGALLLAVPRGRHRNRLTVLSLALLLALGLGCMIRDFRGPRRFRHDAETRALAHSLAARAGPSGRVLILDRRADLMATQGAGALWRWYLLAEVGTRLAWVEDGLPLPATGPVLAVAFSVSDPKDAQRRASAWRQAALHDISLARLTEETVHFGDEQHVTILTYTTQPNGPITTR